MNKHFFVLACIAMLTIGCSRKTKESGKTGDSKEDPGKIATENRNALNGMNKRLKVVEGDIGTIKKDVGEVKGSLKGLTEGPNSLENRLTDAFKRELGNHNRANDPNTHPSFVRITGAGQVGFSNPGGAVAPGGNVGAVPTENQAAVKTLNRLIRTADNPLPLIDGLTKEYERVEALKDKADKLKKILGGDTRRMFNQLDQRAAQIEQQISQLASDQAKATERILKGQQNQFEIRSLLYAEFRTFAKKVDDKLGAILTKQQLESALQTYVKPLNEKLKAMGGAQRILIKLAEPPTAFRTGWKQKPPQRFSICGQVYSTYAYCPAGSREIIFYCWPYR